MTMAKNIHAIMCLEFMALNKHIFEIVSLIDSGACFVLS